MPPRRKRIGWGTRTTTNFTNALATALRSKESDPGGYMARLDQDEVKFLVQQIAANISPTTGSTGMERMFTNWTPSRGGTGLADIMGCPAFHDLDPRKNPSGLPDVVAPIGNTLVLAEFKHPRDKPSERQQFWMEGLARCTHIWSGVVYPKDWEEFCWLLYAMWLEGRTESEEQTDG